MKLLKLSKSHRMVIAGAFALAVTFVACDASKLASRETLATQKTSALEDKLEAPFATRYSGWFYGIEQKGQDNVLALKKAQYTAEFEKKLKAVLLQTLPSLKPHLQVASDASQDEKEAFEYVLEELGRGANRETADFQNATVQGDSNPESEALAALAGQNADEQAQSIIEYLANVPQQGEQARELRARLLMLLGQSDLSNEFTLQALNLVARGVNLSLKGEAYASYETNLANNAIVQIVAKRKTSYIAPDQATRHRFKKGVEAFTAKLRNAKITKVKGLSQNKGVNDSKIVTIEYADGNSDKYLFKSALGTPAFADKYFDNNPNDFLNFVNYTREVRAANFFHLVLDELTLKDDRYAKLFVPLTFEVALYHDGVSYGMGSLQKFLESDYVDIVEHQNTKRDTWNKTLFSSDVWREFSVIIKVLDYTFGNIDRLLVPGVKDDFDKNLMVKTGGNPLSLTGIALIDNGLGLPGRDWYTINMLVSKDHMSQSFKTAFKEKADEVDDLLAGEMYHFVDWGLRDFGKRYADVVTHMGE